MRAELLPDLHGHQVDVPADLSFAKALRSRCHGGKFAPGDTIPAAIRRRVERLPANDRLDPDSACPQPAWSVLREWAGRPVVHEAPPGLP